MLGGPIPDFATRNQHGQPVARSDLAAQRALLVFFPWVFSSICTRELADLRQRSAAFARVGVRLLAISCDAVFTLRAYADAEAIEFDLLADHWPHGAMARAFGVFDQIAGVAVRGSFAVDEVGSLLWSEVKGIGEQRDVDVALAAFSR